MLDSCSCIPYRFKFSEDGVKIRDAYEVLVISSQKGQGLMFPKVLPNKQFLTFPNWAPVLNQFASPFQGGWELDESLEQAACRESLEEAGVVGKVEVGSVLGIPL